MQTDVKMRGINSLKDFVGELVEAGIDSTRAYSRWAKGKKDVMEELFWYQPEGDMPEVNALVYPFFHPELPLIGLNYSKVAHNTLHRFPGAWTAPLRLSRGIVFDCSRDLVALPFHKFFNYGQHPETMTVPDGPFEATSKKDGHLGIIFEYKGKILLTTRGSFTSPSSIIGNEILQSYAEHNDWRTNYPSKITTLVEIIHPETKVYLNYKNWTGFVLIGIFSRNSLRDFNYEMLQAISNKLGIPLTEIKTGLGFASLARLMSDRSVTDEEGYVVRFENGLRVKLKFDNYLAKMVTDKLRSHRYLMQRMMSGNLKDMLHFLPEETYEIALKMLGEILLEMSVAGTRTEKWRSLYRLKAEDEKKSTFETVCRNFVKSIYPE